MRIVRKKMDDDETFDALVKLGTLDRERLLLRVVEDEHIARVLDACDGNRSLAATLLGVARRTLQRKLAPKKRDRRRRRRPRSR